MDIKKISNANNIFYGNNQVKQLYAGSDLIWSTTPSEKAFELLPIVMDSNANLNLSVHSQCAAQGNSTFIMKALNNIKLSDVDITYTYEGIIPSNMTDKLPRLIVNKIDDYCLYFHRFEAYNTWGGGSTWGLFEEPITLTYNNQLSQQQKTINFYGRGDENNQTFISGLYVNKVIKSPSIGSEGVVRVRFFPYTFDDEFFSMTTFKLYLLDYNDTSNNRVNKYLWDNTNQTFTHIITGAVINLNDTMFSSFNITYEGLEGRIEYSIKPNNTNEFKDVALCTYDSMVHFIQEPHNDHRIYISNWRTRIIAKNSKYLDSYTNANEYIFHLCGSKIINKSIQLNFPNESELLYPEILENEYNIEIKGQYELNNNSLIWDNLTFKHYICKTNSKFIFHKK